MPVETTHQVVLNKCFFTGYYAELGTKEAIIEAVKTKPKYRQMHLKLVLKYINQRKTAIAQGALLNYRQ